MAAKKKTVVFNLRDLPKRLSDPLYIGRGSKWGNPFVIGQHGDRDSVLAKFKRLLWNSPALMDALLELQGKQLLCFCAPEKCHGDVLVAALEWKLMDRRQAAAEKTTVADSTGAPPG
jgi:hypothetical protein